MDIEGIEVIQKMVEDKFFQVKQKQKQKDVIYQHMLKEAIKHDGAYKHDWLSQKNKSHQQIVLHYPASI